MYCSINFNIDAYPNLKKLNDAVGNKEIIKYINIIGIIKEDGIIVPSSDFIDYVKSQNVDIEIDFTKDDLQLSIKELALEYYKTKNLDATDFNRDDKISSIVYGYLNIASRNEIKEGLVSLLILQQSTLKRGNKNILKESYLLNTFHIAISHIKESSKTDKEKKELINKLSDLVKTSITSKDFENGVNKIKRFLSENRINSKINETKFSKEYYKHVLKNKIKKIVIDKYKEQHNADITITPNNINTLIEENKDFVQLRNLLSLYNEVIINNKNYDNFFEELLHNSKITFIKASKQVDDLSLSDNLEDEEFDEEELTKDLDKNEVTVDLSIKSFDHSGNSHSFITHVSEDIISYFNSLFIIDKYNNGTFTIKNGELSGLPLTMNATEVSRLLYHYTDKTDINSFIASIERLSTHTQYISLRQIADDMKTEIHDGSSFANKIFRIFRKQVITKVQGDITDGNYNVKISNPNSDPLHSFRNNLFNSFRSHVITLDEKTIKEELNKTILNKVNNGNLNINDTVKALGDIFKYYFGNTISENEILHYIENHKINNEVDKAKNIRSLKNVLSSIAEQISEIQQNKSTRLKNGKDILTTETHNALITLSNLLEDHCIISCEINSINTEGNQSSDVMNSSYITAIKTILKNPNILESYGKFKLLASYQYKLSNILLEHRDKNNNIINYGLFKYTDNGLEKTKYAEELLDIYLYDGIRNNDLDKGSSYAKHSKLDYLGSMFMQFFNNEINKNYQIQKAAYFMRTPSDAPRNWVVNAPKYDIDGLFIDNSNSLVDDELNKIKQIQIIENRKSIVHAIYDKDFYLKSIVNGKIKFKLTSKESKLKNTDETILGIQLVDNNVIYEITVDEFTLSEKTITRNNNVIYYVKGSIKDGYFEGVIEGSNKENNKLDDFKPVILNNLESENKIQRSVNKSHPMFIRIQNMFKQELLDRHNGLSFLFNLDNNGNVLRYSDGTLQWKDENIEIDDDGFIDGSKLKGAVYNYHFKYDKKKNKGIVVERDENNNLKLTGNVFHSDRFILYNENDEAVRNYGEEILNATDENGRPVFNPLYGGAVKINDNQELEFTDAQANYMDSILEEYILDLCKDAYRRLASVKEIIKSEHYNFKDIATLMLNYQVAYGIFNDLFEGDSKVYKDPQDFLKRAKEVQGAGVPYGFVDFLNLYNSTIVKPNKQVKIDYNKDNKKATYTVDIKPTFKAITIKNTIVTNEESKKVIIGQLTETFFKQFKKTLTGKDNELKDLARSKAEALMSGYSDSTANDAQSYITFDEWIRRIVGRGQYAEYKPLISKILSGKELTGEDINEFIQVQKNFYYDVDYNKDANIHTGRQIKNAEFVLVPQLIEGTELEAVYKLMNHYGIDQLNTEETSKAGKYNVLSIFNEKTGKVHKDILDEINSEFRIKSEFSEQLSYYYPAHNEGEIGETYRYEFLYTQQETPQHLADKNKAGIQIMKKIIDNITKDHPQLWDAKNTFIDCYCENIKDSAKTLFLELFGKNKDSLGDNGNIKITENTDGSLTIYGLDYNVFYDKFKQELYRLNVNSNILDYATLEENTKGITIMPSFLTILGKKLENVSQSIFNNSITRQKLPGFHAAQITNIGFRPLANSRKTVSYSKELKYHRDDKGNYVDYVEIMLPKAAFNFNLYDTDGNLKDDETLLSELRDAKLDNVIGYRIPTEGKQSICKMKVVGFIPDGYGSTIVVPNEWVAQTGSDFDIDSIYGIQHATYINDEGKIAKYEADDNTSINKLSRDERTNKLIDSMLYILSHTDSLEECVSRSNFDDISEAKNKVLSESNSSSNNRRKSRSCFNAIDQAEYQEDAMSGAKLKGFSVTRDNFCSICNTIRPTLTTPIDLIYKVKDLKKSNNCENTDDLINILNNRFGHNSARLNPNNTDEIIITHKRFGWSGDNKNALGKILTIYSSQTTAHILDAIKEGFIPNVNDYTFGVYKLFPDIGSDYENAIRFITSDGVTRIVNNYNKSKSIFLNEYINPIEQSIKDIATELGLTIDYSDTIETIIDNIQKSDSFRNNSKLASELYTILKFQEYKTLADNITSLATVCNPDKFGAKQTIYQTNKVFNDITEILNKPAMLVVNGTNILSSIYPDVEKGIVKYITSNNDNSSYKILHTFLKYATAPSIIINRHLFETKSLNFLNFIDKFSEYLNRNKGLTETQVNAFERYVIGELYHKSKLTLPITYISEAIENPFVTLLDENTNEDELRIKEIERILGLNYEPTVNIKIENLSNPTQEEINAFAKLTPAQKIMYLKDNADNIELFDILQVNLYNNEKFNKKQAGRHIISYIDNTTDIEDIYRMFNDIFNSKHPFITLAAYDLIKYAFIAENYTMTKKGISKIIPNSVLKGHPSLNNEGERGIELVDELRTLFTNFEDSIFANDHIYDDFVRSNHELLNIPTRTVVNNELYTRNNRMIIIPYDHGETLDKYKIREKYLINGEVFHTPNRFVKLKINGNITLYKINTVKDGYVLYPLQYLDTNEHTEYSINTKNNLPNIYRETQYKMLIEVLNDYDVNPNNYDKIQITDKNGKQLALDKKISNILTYTANTEEFNELKSKEVKKLTRSDIKIIDANLPIYASITDHLAKEWKSFISNGDNIINEHHMYFLNQGLNSVLYVGEKARVTNLTITKGTGENYIEYSPNLEIYKLSIPALKDIQKQLDGTRKISDRYIALIHNLQVNGIKNIINIDKEGNTKVLFNIYGVKEIKNNTSVRRSSIEEGSVNTEEVSDNGSLVSLNVVAGDILNTIVHTNSKTLEDQDIDKILSNINKLFHAGDPLTVDINEVLANGANYITKRVDSIKHRLQYFITDDSNPDKRYTILSNEAMKAIYEDPDKRNDYLRVLLEGKQILKKNEDIFKLIIEGNNNIGDNQKYYLNVIKNKLNELSKEQSIFNKAWDLFFNEYLKQYTTNPLIKNDTLIVLNGFYSTSSFNAWIGDMQESTNPAIQIITKEVVKDLFAKSKVAEKLKRKFLSKITDLEEQARKEGLSVDYSNIIDEYGRFVDNFKKEFIEDKEKLETAIIESEAEWRKEQDSYLKDLAFIKYYDSIRKFNEWKLKNVEQPLVEDYYKKIIALENDIISKHPEIFYKYKQLQKLRGELYNKCSSDGTLDPAIEKQIDEIDNKLSQLKDPFIYVNGKLEERIAYDGFNTPKGSERDIYNAYMMSYQSSIAINNYEIEYNAIKNEYFQKVEKEQFRDLLKTYLNTISEYEKVNAEGRPIYAKAYLETQKEYVTAKKWIKENARYALSEEMQAELKEAFSKIERGFTNQVLKNIVKDYKCKDEYGVIDARVFTDSEIKAIKDSQLAAKMYTESQSHSDTNLIKMSSPDIAIYTNDFYKGLVLDGITNKEWQNIIIEINDILKQYYDPITKRIDFDAIPDNKEGYAVYTKLGDLYSILQNTKKKENIDKEQYKKVQKFIKENVDTELSKAEKDMFEIAEEKAHNKGPKYYTAWCSANYLVVTDYDTGISRRIPNYYLWGSLKPKADKIDKFTNKNTKEKEEAIKLIDKTYEVVPTEYYYDRLREKETALREGKLSKEEYRKWYYENHIYNNRTKQFEPVKCWITLKVKDNVENAGRWYPRWHNTETIPIISAENPAYKKNVGYAPNYKITGEYTVQNNKNKYEEEISQLFKQVLYDLTKNKKDIKYLDKGYMPSIDKNDKSVGKTIADELLKTLGLKVSATGENIYHDKLGFEINEEISTPFLSRLNQVTPTIRGIVKPIQEDDETDEAFNKRLNEYNKELEALSKENDKAHKNAISNNWKEVMATFIIQASRVNAIRDNELILYAAQHMLETEEILDPKYMGRKTDNEFKVNWNESNKHKTVYSKKDQHELLAQWETWMRRILYDEFKEPNGKLTRWAARFQSITSSQYMMMNFRGGIANITLGGTQILMERLARDYFDSNDYFKALGHFDASILDQLLHMDSDKASTLAGAIIKFMSVVDYNEHKGISVIAENTTMKGFKHFNRLAYSPQTMGENYLQNTVLLAILESNRIFTETDKYGKAKLVFKNEKEYIRDCELDLIERYINQIPDNTLKQQYKNEYNQIKEDIKKDINILAKYAWFKKDLISDFAYKILQTNEAQKQFVKYRLDVRKQAKEEFRNHPTVMSELELTKDGYLDFKPNSTLAKFDVSENGKPSESLLAISGLKGKVISVNKKIHGVYDKLGQAQIEKKWWGSLAMQYHKHIWPGILKRWRIKGYYNEERGSIERGSMWSLLSFISTPIDKMSRNSDISEESKNALKGLQNIFKNILSFSVHIKTHYRLLPDYEKANICRSLAESIGILTAALLTLVVRAIGDEDDEENSIIYNLAIYELDRLASEASIFYVTGAYSEFKKLWSKPIAAQSLAEDAISVMGFITNWLFDENYNPVYQTGRFAGENKIISRLKRRIPFYRGIHTGLFDIVENNRYYKVGENILNNRLIEEAIEWIEDEE